MSSIYTPDKWVVVEINSKEHGKIRKVLASWYGGFAGSNSWKMNSGITKVIKSGDIYTFEGYTGSLYKCHKDAHGMSMYTASVLADMQEQAKTMEATIEVVEVVDYEDSFTV